MLIQSTSELISVYSLNLENTPFRSSEQLRALERIIDRYDIIGLQAVSESMFEKIENLVKEKGHQIHAVAESIRKSRRGSTACYSVFILRPIEWQSGKTVQFMIEHSSAFFVGTLPSPTESRLRDRLREFFDSWDGTTQFLKVPWIDVRIGNQVVRIFNVHLPRLLDHVLRREIFLDLLNERQLLHNIILGDLNIPTPKQKDFFDLYTKQYIIDTMWPVHATQQFNRRRPGYIIVPMHPLWRIATRTPDEYSGLSKKAGTRCMGVGVSIRLTDASPVL